MPAKSISDTASDRWFTEQRDGRRQPKRLNIPNEALVTSRGPIKLTGNITLVDETGRQSHHNELKLCRCGGSQNKPMCDDRHIDLEFVDRGTIEHASDIPATRASHPLKVTVVKDGPLKYQGYLRVYNQRGQECVSMNGALCRCGQSSRKPFCDCV
ncbi:CDGSH iron-sulfur domain-containing protein [Marinihelvus fidelis]|uniref:CDGSH iron-sulfur domain-containing protein n=1 Tax=Marinihelvus fidelis TaxID=2613842 RepID=UPI00178556F7|nr:CDGSH iron-sulfur domain-containing protein [Marinihelvus fidelis]